MTKIKFGTDGWRAIIADTYTLDNVKRVAQATAHWLKKQSENPSAVVGNDCRFGGRMFAETTAKVFCTNGIKVYLAENLFVSTPMISLATTQLKANAGIVITASHNPPNYNGFKIKAHFGGPALPDQIAAVENLIPDENITLDLKSIETYQADGLIEKQDLESRYINEIKAKFDLDLINNSGISLCYDPMYGAGQRVLKDILKNVQHIRAEYNPSFHGVAPEPILKNLQGLADLCKSDQNIQMGLATDGDADRIGLMDSDGNFVDSHHILLLLIHYLHKYKGLNGKVIITFSCSKRIAKLCELYGLDYEITKIGFKYICGIMVKEDVLVGGEESGGLAIKGHIPERDGIWIGLAILEFMAKSGKSLKQLIQEIYDLVGSFANERYDLHLSENQKQAIIEKCKTDPYKSFGNYHVKEISTIDGFKFDLGNDETVMIRPSGTEPVLRVYAESADSAACFRILDTVKASILG